MSEKLLNEINGGSPSSSIVNSPGNSDGEDSSDSLSSENSSMDEEENIDEISDPESTQLNDKKFPIKRKLKQIQQEQQTKEGSKKQKTEANHETFAQTSSNPDTPENDASPEKSKDLNEIFDKKIKVEKEVDLSELKQEETSESEDFDITEKLKEMGEISVKAISKSDASKKSDQNSESAASVEISKKDPKKVQNLRKNIKDVLDDSQLDAATLAAQRQESERLARVQEQQRLIREVQKQIAMEKQTAKTQQKLLTFFQNHALKSSPSSESLLLKNQKGYSAEEGTSSGSNKISLTPSVSIQSTSGSFDLKILEDLQKESLLETEEMQEIIEKKPIDLKLEDDDEIEMGEDIEIIDKKPDVTIIDSSSDDDCIILSDEEEEEEEPDDPHNSGLHVNDTYNIPDSQGRVVVNIGHPENESDIYVAPQIARIIKPHQIGGVRFLFDNIIESIDRFNSSTGFGCILAHSMGLGKTLQLVCFCDIFLRHTSSKTILVIMPINTLQNWIHEFNMWIPLPEDVDKCPLKDQGEVRPRNFKIHVLNDSQKTLNARAKVVLEWLKDGGVLMMGYEMYRLLSQKKMAKPKKKKKVASFMIGGCDENEKTSSEDQEMFDKIHEALVKPGPDLVVCDEVSKTILFT